MIILGIDPGSRKTGYGLIEKSGNHCRHIENGTLYLEKEQVYKKRLVLLFEKLQNLIQTYEVKALAVEDVFYHKNPLAIQKLAEVRGVVILAAGLLRTELGEYTALQVKQAVTGHGKASKDQVQVMVTKLLNLKDRAEENASDALAIALCHAHHKRLPADPGKKSFPSSAAQDMLKKARYYR